MTFRATLAACADEFGISLTEEQLQQFQIYYEMLIEWNKKINLTAITAPEEVAIKHMLDSLAAYDSTVFPAGCSVVDIGTGAGFPGVPLKIFRPDLRLTLLDSLQKRLKFLEQLVDRIGLKDVNFVHLRAEDAGRGLHRERYDVAVARAVARLNVLAEFCLPSVVVGGWFVALKGAQYCQEMEEARHALSVLGGSIMQAKAIELPRISDSRGIVYIKKLCHTPSAYPRRAGMPEKKPL